MDPKHLVVIGDSRRMAEVPDDSVQLIVTSPPYFDVKDYGQENIGSLDDFSEYLEEMQLVFKECHRVLENGRYICVNICDIISHKYKYPIPAHYVLLLQRAGFEYREDIIWRKPSGVGANGAGGAAKRFGVFIQHPYHLFSSVFQEENQPSQDRGALFVSHLLPLAGSQLCSSRSAL
ncbi:TPA: site-specific DNA-methyltransferase [Candidatus Woesearchaeota archaeon]|nr:site-specific DNA-methyltransferase [Candidatus Woesearchaeota archaeon]